MHQSSINIDVLLDPDKVPQQISWTASDSTADMAQQAKAMCIAFWDGAARVEELEGELAKRDAADRDAAPGERERRAQNV